jgi:signal transduction histidine kinase
MKKSSIKNLILHISMHLCAAIAAILIADILFCSYISVSFINGEKKYALDPFRFSDSDIEDTITDIFATQAADIMKYNASRELLGAFDGLDTGRIVDVSDYYHGDDPISFNISLSELINLGRRDIMFSDRTMNLSEFVKYFNDPVSVGHYALDENGKLYFAGFDIEPAEPVVNVPADETETMVVPTVPEKTPVEKEFERTSASDLMVLVVGHLIRKYPDFISISSTDDGITVITFKEPVLENESAYILADIRNASSDWNDYFTIVSELKNASVLYSNAYDVYRTGNDLYSGESSNFVYTIKTKDVDLNERLYTNINDLPSYDDEQLDAFYSGHAHYLICYYNELRYSTLSRINESVITDVLRMYPDVYPNNTHIWMCIEDMSSMGNDIYYDLKYRYNDIQQYERAFTVLIVLLALVWFILFLCLIMRNEDISYPQDRIFLELILAFGIAAFFLMRTYYNYLVGLVEANHGRVMSSGYGAVKNAGIVGYILFAGFGLAFSFIVSFVAFTIARRAKSGDLFGYSILRKIGKLFEWFALTLSGGSKATATVLVPYILFLIANLVGQSLSVYLFRENKFAAIITLAVIIIVDIYTGITLFLNTAEKKKLIDGVERIRSGETDYKIDVQNLRAENRDLAESINNIGDGINTAVKSSMMEEQLRTELITNVSHDLKTPLTSIINYSDILNNRDISDEQRKEYLEIIGEKSRRLKKLLEDLLEASKLSSGKMELHKEKTDLTELLNQALGEYEDRFSSKGLDVVCNDYSRVYINADAGSVWRIFNNLFENISKYAMDNTRIYVDLENADGRVKVSVKNVSREKLRFQGNELTERFIRGDESRNTEGTGLGLFIAKSLTEANDGEFEILVDGDVFTSVMTFPSICETDS